MSRSAAAELKLLGRSLNLGQVCGIVGMALYDATVPGEASGIYLRILHILRILMI